MRRKTTARAHLVSRALQILMHHIKATLPDIKQKISSNLTKYEQELASLGGPQGEGSNVRFPFTHLAPSDR